MNNILAPNLLNSFLIVYFYYIETKLNNSKNGIEQLKFQSEESNTDEFLKKFFQEFLITNNSINGINLKKLSISIDNEIFDIQIKDLLNYKITNVFIPEQLTNEQKKVISNLKESVYTNPDLYIEITNNSEKYYESIELKSTKYNKIPGSSVQQVIPFHWVIFVKRELNNVSVTTGFYINCITDKLSFPDRSPRPQVSFNTLLEWNNKYRKAENKILTVENLTEINIEKIKLLKDWQDYLASEWLEIIKSDSANNTEKWFNNTIRKFAVKLLEFSDALNKDEKQKMINDLKRLIK